MKIKFWGTRGSIPVPDKRMMHFGGNTTCVEISCGGRTLILDAGTGIRNLGESLQERGISDMDILVTHSHWDHIQGLPFFQPLYSSKATIDILGCSNSYRRLQEILSQQMSQEYFPVSFSDLTSKITFYDACNDQYDTHGYEMRFIRTNHPVFTLGVRLQEGRSSFVFMTDNELGSAKPVTQYADFVEFCKGADYLIHDAQFTDEEYVQRSGWGHSTFAQALKLAADAGVKNLGFFHHDPNRKDDELIEIGLKLTARQKEKNYTCKPFFVKELDEITL